MMLVSKSITGVFFLLIASSTFAAAQVNAHADVAIGNSVTGGNVALIPALSDSVSHNGGVASTLPFVFNFTGLDSLGNAGTTTFSGDAGAQTSYGSLRAYVESTLQRPLLNATNAPYFDELKWWETNSAGVPTAFSANAKAYFSDTLFIPNPNVVSIKLGLDFSGQIVGSEIIDFVTPPTGSAFVSLTDGVNHDDETSVLYDSFESSDINESLWSSPLNVSAGSVSFGVRLVATVGFYPIWAPSMEGNEYTTIVDLSNTLTLNSIAGFDVNGNLVSLNGSTTASGVAYNLAAPVPEPETYAMMLVGLSVLGFERFHTKLRQRRSEPRLG